MKSSNPSHQVIVCETPEEASVRVARIIAEAIGNNPQLVLGLATGGTPTGVYRHLVQMHREDKLDFSEVTTFNLDEYIGIPPEHPQSYRTFMQEHLFNHVNLNPAKTHLPDGCGRPIATRAEEYETMIRDAGGIDLQLLGIGNNGHIAFNEPGSPAASRTRQVDLTEDTIVANSRFFASMNDVPRHAITMGIATILEARRIVLMATGEAKAEAIDRAIQGPLDSTSPASQLQGNPNVTYVLDAAAAGRLSMS